jgi:hypothetical protein
MQMQRGHQTYYSEWKLGGIRKSMQIKGDIRDTADFGNWEELERVCGFKGDVKHTAACGNWKELERVCRIKSDISHPAECGNWEELETVCRCKRMSNTLLNVETGRN